MKQFISDTSAAGLLISYILLLGDSPLATILSWAGLFEYGIPYLGQDFTNLLRLYLQKQPSQWGCPHSLTRLPNEAMSSPRSSRLHRWVRSRHQSHQLWMRLPAELVSYLQIVSDHLIIHR